MNIKEALQVFDFEEYISVEELKKRYRSLQKKFHPDLNRKSSKESINKINTAYKILMDYLEKHEIPIEELLKERDAEEKLKKRFSDDWLSGKVF